MFGTLFFRTMQRTLSSKSLSPRRSAFALSANPSPSLTLFSDGELSHDHWQKTLDECESLISKLRPQGIDKLYSQLYNTSHREHDPTLLDTQAQIYNLLGQTRVSAEDYETRFQLLKITHAFKEACLSHNAWSWASYEEGCQYEALYSELYGKTTLHWIQMLQDYSAEEIRGIIDEHTADLDWRQIDNLIICARYDAAKICIAPPKMIELTIATRSLMATEILEQASQQNMISVLTYPQSEHALPVTRKVDYAYPIADEDISNPAAYETALLKHRAILAAKGLLNLYRIANGRIFYVSDPAKAPIGAVPVYSRGLLPGYGGISELHLTPEMCLRLGITPATPPASAMALLGDKARARALALQLDCPVIPGYHGKIQETNTLIEQARIVGGGVKNDEQATYQFPILLKDPNGGGGAGIILITSESQLREELPIRQKKYGPDAEIVLEQCLENPTHLEMQVFVDKYGHVVDYGVRDCSPQVHRGKIVEVGYNPTVFDNRLPGIREQMRHTVKTMLGNLPLSYLGAGTFEFLLVRGKLYFLECNTRLQVERAITEQVLGGYVNFIALQLHLAAGGTHEEYLGPILKKLGMVVPATTKAEEMVKMLYEHSPYAISMEARVNAVHVDVNYQDAITFTPSHGELTEVCLPQSTAEILIGCAYETTAPNDGKPKMGVGTSGYLNTHIASVIGNGKKQLDDPDGRKAIVDACRNTRQGLQGLVFGGIHTNIDYDIRVLDVIEQDPSMPLDTGLCPIYVDPVLRQEHHAKQSRVSMRM